MEQKLNDLQSKVIVGGVNLVIYVKICPIVFNELYVLNSWKRLKNRRSCLRSQK